MKERLLFLTLLLAFSLFVSCYHARIETGLAPSSKVVEQTFASGWVYGLVPPSTVKAASECPNGVAVVETELSFVNQLVGVLTLGIYTPMHIKVTCAESGSMGLLDESPESHFSVSEQASDEEIMEVFELAAKRAVATQQAVYVQF